MHALKEIVKKIAIKYSFYYINVLSYMQREIPTGDQVACTVHTHKKVAFTIKTKIGHNVDGRDDDNDDIVGREILTKLTTEKQ